VSDVLLVVFRHQRVVGHSLDLPEGWSGDSRPEAEDESELLAEDESPHSSYFGQNLASCSAHSSYFGQNLASCSAHCWNPLSSPVTRVGFTLITGDESGFHSRHLWQNFTAENNFWHLSHTRTYEVTGMALPWPARGMEWGLSSSARSSLSSSAYGLGREWTSGLGRESPLHPSGRSRECPTNVCHEACLQRRMGSARTSLGPTFIYPCFGIISSLIRRLNRCTVTFNLIQPIT
jgi:hypothetical protein